MLSATVVGVANRSRGLLRGPDIPVRDPRFWIIQLLVFATFGSHLLLESVQLLKDESELYLLSASVFLIPVVYAGLVFGLRGAFPTAIWALLLSIPEISYHRWATKVGILIQFVIITAIGAIVAMRVDRERAAARTTDQANERLSRLNATASAVAESLDLNHVLSGTLRASLNPDKSQVVWIRTLRGPGMPGLTLIQSSKGDPPAQLDQIQEHLTEAACLTGRDQRDDPAGVAVHTAVTALMIEEKTVGAIGVSQPVDGIQPVEVAALGAIANQLGVALNNIRNHASTREALSELSKAKENLETYIKLATEAQEEERKRLSRELHDDILQSLVVAKAQIDLVNASNLPDDAHARLAGIQEVLAASVKDVRRYCRDLRPSLLDDLGLIDAIEWLVGDLTSRTSMTVDIQVKGPWRRLNGRDELMIFRVVQEALRNVERHADATRALVGLDFGEESLAVSVADNGKGLPSAGLTGGHQSETALGLRGLSERAKLLKGSLSVKSQRGQGTQILLLVPLAQDHQ